METYRHILFDVGMDVTENFPESHLPERIVPPEMGDESLAEWAALDNGETVEVELVVVGGDGAPALDLVSEAGPAVRQEAGAVLVGEISPAGNPHVYTVGDTTAWREEAFPPSPT